MLTLEEHLKLEADKHIVAALVETNGDRNGASELLGISIATLYRRIPDDAPVFSRQKRLEYVPKNELSGVYLMSAGEGVYKIGYSCRVRQREGELRVGNHLIKLVACWAGTREDELKLHRMLMHKRLSGEWFKLDNVDIMEVSMHFNGASQV